MKGVSYKEVVDRALMVIIGLVAIALALYFTGGKKSSFDISLLLSIATAFVLLFSITKNNLVGSNGFK